MREHDDTTAAPASRPAEVVEISLLREQRHADLLAEARTLMMECRDEEALAHCERALKLAPDSEEALVLASTLSVVRGANREGLAFALEMVQVNPAEADGYYEAAMCLIDMGYPEEALAWLEMGDRHIQDREGDIVDFFCAAQAEALALLFRYEEAEAALEAARNERGDEMGLLGDAAERLTWLRRRSEC